jgi:hypothetical protein
MIALRSSLVCLCLVSVLLSFAGRVGAQNQSGEIRGQITDERGAAIV